MASLAFLFPGQGSQYEGMGQDLFTNSSHARERYAEAHSILGWSVIDLSTPESGEKINTTCYTQPALYTLSCIISEHLLANGIQPAIVAGHSAGEYAALTTAGAWDFATGLRVIAERARLMHEKAAPGAMAAVLGLEEDALQTACSEWTEGSVSIANYNSPRQIVISGDENAVHGIMPLLKERGARRVLPLPVSGAFHSPLMKDAQQLFDEFLSTITINPPRIPWVSNNTATIITEAETVRQHLVRQFCEPVRWVQSLKLIEQKCDTALEVGAGKVLQGLVKQCTENLPCEITSTFEQTEKVIQDYGKQT
ncbi:MAG: ACP S-malonyltransferase [bacterium]|jgi:[acyl-carrier-protein] S-malonyltransferase